ncbi:MAG: extracellular solute-binding protein [Anaerolineae bacterium]
MNHSARITRRGLLHWFGVGAAATAIAACQPATSVPEPTQAPAEATKAPAQATAAPQATETPIPAPPTATPPPTAAPRIFGSGKIEVVSWHQDWDGANRILASMAPKYVEQHPDVTLNQQAIGYGDLFSKMLPAIAAGTEGDVMMAYSNWMVATDIKQVFLDITEAVGGASALAQEMWPAAFGAFDVPEGKIFYVPWLAGIRGACTTVNTDHLAEAGIDYLSFKTFEELVDSGVKLTKKDSNGKISRAGFSPRSVGLTWMFQFVWQLGGKVYDKETGKWSWSTPEGETAAQLHYDLYWKHQTCDFELFTSEFDGVSKQLVSMWADGAWTCSVQGDVAKVPCDNLVTPFLANATTRVLYPDHEAIWALSRRLAKDPDKMKAALDWALLLVSPDATIQAFDFYSGVCMTKAVYDDPRIEQVKFGKVSKRIAQGMWPYARYNQDRVADLGPAATELDRAMRKEISIKEALANMDTYCQEQEDATRERLGLS